MTFDDFAATGWVDEASFTDGLIDGPLGGPSSKINIEKSKAVQEECIRKAIKRMSTEKKRCLRRQYVPLMGTSLEERSGEVVDSFDAYNNGEDDNMLSGVSGGEELDGENAVGENSDEGSDEDSRDEPSREGPKDEHSIAVKPAFLLENVPYEVPATAEHEPHEPHEPALLQVGTFGPSMDFHIH
ncbi:hypothetical protein FRC11_011516 [Ceratobasidium sp. 423]|nr:hypothetical protein FRC11_011516 [Ceratobasidium sp. 423]